MSSTAFDLRGEIAKLDRSRRMAFGWAATSPDGKSVVLDEGSGETISLEELEKAAYRILNDQPKGDGRLVESFVLTKEKARALGLPASAPTGWWIGLQFGAGESWENISSGLTRTLRVRGKGRKMSTSLKNKPLLSKKEVTHMSKTSALAVIEAKAAQYEAQGLAPATAFAKAMAESPTEVQKYREQRESELEEVESPFEKQARLQRERLAKLDANPARKRFHGEVETLKKQHPSLTEAEAWKRACESRPDLYAAARRETS